MGVALTDIVRNFAEMIAIGHQIRARNDAARRLAERMAELEALFSEWSDDALVGHWNSVGCDFNCSVICCEDVHAELNRRGLGNVCAV